jgi:hypothetical protein
MKIFAKQNLLIFGSFSLFAKMEKNRFRFNPTLDGHCHEKSVLNKHGRGGLGPSIWTTTIFKNCLIVPLKATIFEKNHLYYINRNFTLCYSLFL